MGVLSSARKKSAGLASADDQTIPELPPEPQLGGTTATGMSPGLVGQESSSDDGVITALPPDSAEAEAFIAGLVNGPEATEARAIIDNCSTRIFPAPNAEAAAAATATDPGDATAIAAPPDVAQYLEAVDRLIRRIGPTTDQAKALASAEAQEAWQQLRGMTTGAVALGLRQQLSGVFGKYGRPGEGLLAAALVNGSLAQGVAYFKSPTPVAPTPPSQASSDREPQQQRHAGAGGSGFSALARLMAAPVTVPLAAGSRVWQFLSNRFGPRPAIPANYDAFSVVKNQFDDACGRAIDKISHIRSGPMNPHLSEMVANPLKLNEQFQRMAVEGQGEFHDRAQRLKETLSSPVVQSQFAELRDALDQVQYRGRRLAEAGHDVGEAVDEHIAARVEELAHKAEGLPTIDKEGHLKDFQETIREVVARIQEFLRSLFSKHAPA